jgi:hypothetical protein
MILYIDNIVQIYLSRYWPNLEGLLKLYKDLPSLENAICHASQGHNQLGKVHAHQRRIKKFAKENVQNTLLEKEF